MAKLLEAAPGIKYRAALGVAYGAGLRVSEVAHFKAGDIDNKHMLIRIEEGKGRKDRNAVLSPQLLELLRVWWREGIGELNAAIADLMARPNDRVMRRFGRSRRQLFEELDAPHLKALPTEPYILAQWRRCKVGLDYHVEVERHFYSVPYRHARASVEVRLTARTLEVFLKGERIAAHLRGSGNGRHASIADHMPSSHRRYAD